MNTEKEYNEILKQIESDDSPVGIDAGKTHVLSRAPFPDRFQPVSCFQI